MTIEEVDPWDGDRNRSRSLFTVCIGLGDRNAARAWAEKRLPTMASESMNFGIPADEAPVNPRREEWVNESVAQAKERLKDAERLTKRSFGKPENYYQRRDSNQMLDEDGDAWQ